MYEHPVLNEIGEAGKVILGVVSFGDDVDGQVVIPGFEFASDADAFD